MNTVLLVFESDCKLMKKQLEYDLKQGKISKEKYDDVMVRIMEMEFQLSLLKHIKLEHEVLKLKLEALN